ncbi:unnamed protein product [Penicillium pancosmium]
MVYPLPYDPRHFIQQNSSPAYGRDFIYPASSSIVHSRPQDLVGGFNYGFTAAPFYYPYSMQNYPTPSQPLYPQNSPYDTAAIFHHKGLPSVPAQGFPKSNMLPRLDPLNSGLAGGRPSGAGLGDSRTIVDRKIIVDGSRPTALKQPSSGSTNGLANSIPTISTAPCRPKLSRCSLWAGNIPRSAKLLDLKNHFSSGASGDIESVFLISRSNCAFVNYRSFETCIAALSRCHGSDFQGSRLVCKLQKGTIEGDAASQTKMPVSCPRDESSINSKNASMSTDRYFVMKSLTKEALEASRQDGIWTTQTHNEVKLNQAFESSQQVYLIFSANKSGEYFGYARMMSGTNDKDLLREFSSFKPRDRCRDVLDATPTCSTSVAPKGRVISDLTRNIMIWEANCLEDESMSDDISVNERQTEAQPLGRPFHIQWLSHRRVSFHRTHDLRNPWNFNRRVKIARDGTEIEPTVGQKLVRLFNGQ